MEMKLPFRRPRTSNPLRRLQVALAALAVVLTVGTAGYWLGTDLSLVDAIYYTVITVTTVDFERPPDATAELKMFTIFLILSAVLVTAWALSSAAELIFAEVFWTYLGRQRMKRTIDKLSGHTIVCGYGRMGMRVCQELDAEDQAWVMVDSDEHLVNEVQVEGGLAVLGDATLDETLIEAGIDRAKALIAVTRDDASNIVICLGARALCPELMIASRAERADAVSKLRRAGANYVLQHHGTAAMHLALSVTHPMVEEVLNLLIPRRGNLDLGQILVTSGSSLKGRTLARLDTRRYGALVVAIWHENDLSVPPKPDVPLEVGDVLIVAGPAGALRALRESTHSGEVAPGRARSGSK